MGDTGSDTRERGTEGKRFKRNHRAAPRSGPDLEPLRRPTGPSPLPPRVGPARDERGKPPLVPSGNRMPLPSQPCFKSRSYSQSRGSNPLPKRRRESAPETEGVASTSPPAHPSRVSAPRLQTLAHLPANPRPPPQRAHSDRRRRDEGNLTSRHLK